MRESAIDPPSGWPRSKSEARNPKSETNSNEEISNSDKTAFPVLDFPPLSSFGFVSDFVLRISDFKRRLCDLAHFQRTPKNSAHTPLLFARQVW